MPKKKLEPTSAASQVEHGSSVQHAFQQIRDLIVHGHLAPGAWIIEAELVLRLGLSRTPVRGALQRLQREGYVVEQKARLNSRMMVAPLTHGDARELYAIVARIEGLAGRNAALLPHAERIHLIQIVQPLHHELRDIAKTRALHGRSIFDLDLRFHQAIVEAGAGTRLRALHHAIKPQTERYWRLYASNILDQLHLAVAEHETILRALRDGEPEAAEAALIANWVNGAERIAPLIAQQGDIGTW